MTERFREEFPDFVLDVTLPDGWEDTSWHNDSCPSFEFGKFRLWIDYADCDHREIESGKRFMLVVLDDHADFVEVCSTDNWSDMLDILAAITRIGE